MSDPSFSAAASPWRTALLVVGAVAFVVIGIWIAGLFGEPPRPGTEWLGWIGAVFFGLCGVIGLRQMFDTRESVRISAHGIYSRQWSEATIPWSEITDVTVWEYRAQRSIILHLAHPELFPSQTILGRLAGLNRALTGGDVAITLTGTGGNFDKAMGAIAHYGSRPEFTRR